MATENMTPGMGSRVSRRDFFKKASAGSAAVALGAMTISSAQATEWDEETDVVVVGSGGAALAGAAGALLGGASVKVFEKAAFPGGTTGKSGGQYWIPNSPWMRAAGLEDPKDDCLKYMARLAHPHLYKADHPTLGLDEHNYKMLEAFYDQAGPAFQALHDAGALRTGMGLSHDGIPAPDYFAHLDENKPKGGRTSDPLDEDGNKGYGATIIDSLSYFVEDRGGEIITETQVSKIIMDENRVVIGVEVADANGTRKVRALKGVIFGSGGFTQNEQMRNSYLRVPVLGGCAVPTNQGDLVNMSIEIGAKLGNMNEAWLQQEILEEVLEFSSVPSGIWFLGGDSMIVVNKHGKRLYDEKFVYNERTRTHLTWSATEAEYTNLYQFMIFDDHATETGGMLMPPPGSNFPSYIIKADTRAELATAIQERLDSLSEKIGSFKLGPKFVEGLEETITRFNGFAAAGKDEDFNRGEAPIDTHFHGKHDNNHMHPISETGPFYCIILGAGTLDTRGGPVTDELGRVLDVKDQVIEGLYASGNCVASLSGQSYWGAGGTLGPAITFGYLAGQHAAQRA